MSMLKVEFYVPLEHVKTIIKSLNDNHLITEGNFDYCYSYTPVKGHFRPINEANPYIGKVGELTHVDEVKVEFRIQEAMKELTEQLIKKHHPYEVPVINFRRLV